MPNFTHRSIYHGWLPRNPEVHAAFLRTHVSPYAPNAPVLAPPPVAATKDLDDLVKEFFEAIDKSPDMKARFELIFQQVNKDKRWAPMGEDFRVHDLEHLRKALTSAISGPPKVYVVKREEDPKIAIGEPIGIPIYLVLDLLINTDAAHDLFRMDEFNTPMQKLLKGWGYYLTQSGSNSTLNTDDEGWLGSYGLSVLEQGLKRLSFEQTYGVDPEEAQNVYLSWDAFFIRPIQNFDKLRPVTKVPGLHLLYNACESTSVRTAHNVKLNDTFWLKTQNYSLWDMLGGNSENSLAGKYAQQLVGGSVYQAFLAPQDYHHWHSPIDGTVMDAVVIPGTFYAALPDDGAPQDDQHLRHGDPHGAFMRSQPWLNVAAARGVVIIKPKDTVPPSPIELICVIAIGMVEVSTIDITVGKSTGRYEIAAGDELGMFHFGGSSHTVIVKPKKGNQVVFADENDIPITPNQHRWVRSIIGRVAEVNA